MQSLSDEQQFVFDKFKQGENIFLTGSAGTGKTFLIQKFVNYLKLNQNKYQVCALTGTAALLLNCNARTLHSFAGIGLCNGTKERVISSVLGSKYKVKNWRTTKILIVDEVSMMSLKLFKIIEEIGRQIHNTHLPFGGMQIIFTGDFGQLPPIETSGEPDTKSFCFESPIWNNLFKQNQIELKTIYRQTDPLYRSILLQIRDGNISEENIQLLQGYVNREFDPSLHGGCVPTKIFPTRVKVDYVNKLEYNKIKEKEYVFECKQKTDCLIYLDSFVSIPVEILRLCEKLAQQEIENELQLLITNSNITQILRLKKGSIVMCTSNIDMDQGICNGSQGVVVDIFEKTTNIFIPVVKFHNGITKMLDPIFRQSEDFPTIAVGQIPLMLAWSVTIHKTQGATIDMGEIDIGNNIFEYGQTYVALSRIKSLEGLYLKEFNPSKIKANPKVREFYSNLIDINVLMDQERTKRKEFKQFNFDKYKNNNECNEKEETTNVKILKISSPEKSGLTVKKSNEEPLETQINVCCVCLTGSRTVLLFPCKHLCLCDRCGSEELSNTILICPICRNGIQQRMNVYV